MLNISRNSNVAVQKRISAGKVIEKFKKEFKVQNITAYDSFWDEMHRYFMFTWHF